ncbi:tyrosine-type recombinase/integrase [Roseibium alexandrii]|uniref:Integrase n=1 Tax=Roseibium alexandrii TaxID=388408 RepID=A0A0M7AGP9_9HYPH|nr:site-specific integrase [Roseibium alexandrii]CTQ73612.1 integrase [Roseibium alexandrii]
MASYRKHKGRCTATVRIPADFTGPVAKKSLSETFRTKTDAKVWAQDVETQIKLGTWKDPRLEQRMTSGRWEDRPLRETIERYRKAVTPTMKGMKQETSLLKRWERHPLAQRPIRTINRSDIAAYRDERVEQGRAPQTVRNELNKLSAVFQYAKYDWGYELVNPVRELTQRKGALPKARKGRDRRLVGDEQERLEEALLAGDDGENMLALWRLLLDTGMRLSEVLSLDAGCVRDGDRSLVLTETKNGDDREVLVSDEAWADLLEHVAGLDDVEPLINLHVDAVEYRCRIARKAANVTNFKLHDLRHEALSRMAARDVDLKTMMLQSGHKTPAMLLRYLNPTAEERRRKLFGEGSRTESQVR